MKGFLFCLQEWFRNMHVQSPAGSTDDGSSEALQDP